MLWSHKIKTHCSSREAFNFISVEKSHKFRLTDSFWIYSIFQLYFIIIFDNKLFSMNSLTVLHKYEVNSWPIPINFGQFLTNSCQFQSIPRIGIDQNWNWCIPTIKRYSKNTHEHSCSSYQDTCERNRSYRNFIIMILVE